MIDLATEIDLTTRIVVAIVLGGVIGLEREIKGHVAGLRTNMLICLGSALFMITGELVTRQFVTLSPAPDPTRIGSTIVTGV
ncbi:MAG: MgtC/SapB family protein, partial [Chloroflexi bacterium]|nr:MgtC/SapB family protein [Chloroflexota bacterium]